MFNKLMAKVDHFKHKHDRHAKVPTEDKVEDSDAHNTATPPDDAGSSTRPEQRIPSPERKQEVEDVKDYWHEALKSLPLDKQAALKSMGLDQQESGSVESSFKDLVAIVNERQKECERKFWRISVRGKTIVLRNYTTSIIDWIEKTGDIAMPFAPTQIALSWSIVKFVLQIPLDESEQMAALLGTTEKIVRIICRGQAYEKIYLDPKAQGTFDPVTKNLEAGLIKIYGTSLDILADAGTLFSKNTAQRTLEAIVHPEKASGALSDIDKQENQLLRDVQVCENRRSVAADEHLVRMIEILNAPIKHIDEGVNHLLEYIQDKERTEILEWISSIPFGKNHNRVKENRTPGTGDWILHHKRFRDWKENSSSGLFWLQGSPGAGKTFLASSVIDHIQDLLGDSPDHEGFAFFYCDRNDTLRTQALSVLQSFVRQLSTTERSPKSMRVKLREAYNLARSRGTDFQFEQCKEQILESLNIYPRTILVIDAMDECDSEKRYRLIDALKSFILECKNTVKIFISSRPDSNIKSHLASVPSVTISASDNHDDIERFLDFELDKLATDKGIRVLGRMKTEIMIKLLEKCQGMFQWAAMQVHQLKDCSTATNVREMLENLPDDLQKSYDQVWSQIEALREPDQTLAKRALRWTMASLRPLESRELLLVIRMGQDGRVLAQEDSIEEDSLILLCKNLIVLDTKSDVWRFAHISVLEYLESKPNWTLPWAHHHAANVCLSHLINFYKEDSTEHSSPPEDLSLKERALFPTVTLNEVMKNEDLPSFFFLKVMDFWWAKHVYLAQDTENKTLQSCLNAFLGPPNNSNYEYQTWYLQIASSMTSNTVYELYSIDLYDGEYPRSVFYHLSPPEFSIFAICRFGFSDTLRSWRVHASSYISLVNERGESPLSLACNAGHLKICQMLLEDGADVNLRLEGELGGTALVSAASSGHFEIVKYLVEMGADVNMVLGEKEGIHDNALSAAILSGNAQIVGYILEKTNFDVNMPFPKAFARCSSNIGRQIEDIKRARPRDKALCHGYAIGMAAWAPGTELLRQVLDAGADVNQPLGCEFWPSVLAIKIKLQEVDSVKFLVQEARADPNLPFETGEFGSALEAACCFGYELVEALLMGGADVNMPLKNGRFGSALSAAACSTYDHDVVKLLITAGADVNMFLENRDFSTAIALVAAIPVSLCEWPERRHEMVTLLIKAGAELNPKCPVGRYGGALMAAALFGEEETVQYLIDAGANVNHRFEDIPYTTALQAAQADGSEKDWEWIIMFHNRFVYPGITSALGVVDGQRDDLELRSWLKRRKDRTACLLKENGAMA